MKRICTTAVASIALALCSAIVSAGPRVEIVVGTDAPKLSRFAAAEMSGQLKTLFDADVSIGNTASAGAPHVIYLGEPQTNPALAKAIANNWPKLSDQGILIKSIGPADKRQLIVGGGSPIATLWAAYELGHRYGLRYLLSGDALPAEPTQFTLDRFDVLLEPTLQLRAWQLLGSFPYISDAWDLEDQQRLLRQLAKLKFNHVVLKLDPAGPFFTAELSLEKTSAAPMFRGHHFTVDGDTPGRKAFKGVREFANPDFAGKKSIEETTAASQRFVHSLIDTAHELGMAVGIDMSNQAVPIFGGLRLDRNEVLTDEFLQSSILSCVKTFPTVDSLYLNHSLSKKREFLKELTKVESPTGSMPQRLEIAFVNPDLTREPVESLPADDRYCFCALSRVSMARVMTMPSPKPRTTVILPLCDFKVGVLPNQHGQLLHKAVLEMRKSNWRGFQIFGPMVGDLDSVAQFLSRASFDATATFDGVCHDLFDTLCGNSDIATRLMKGFDHIEQANEKIALTWGQGVASPNANCLKNLLPADPTRAAVAKESADLYLQAMNEMFRAHDHCHPSSRRYVYYYARRCEFAFQYMNFVQAYYAAEEAKAKKDTEARLEQLSKAVEALYNGLNSLGDVARDQSDRGTIAVLTEFAYRPLVRQLDQETDEAEKEQ